MALASDKIMFEIYREQGYNRRYRAVYFTELNEHNKEHEINAALAGEHVYDGFILGATAGEAKRAINELLTRLNAGAEMDADSIERAIAPYTPA